MFIRMVILQGNNSNLKLLDGKYEGKPCLNDTFAYILKYKTFIDDIDYEYLGTILLTKL